MSIREEDSRTIDLLRFPLVICVVFIHTLCPFGAVCLSESDHSLLSGHGMTNAIMWIMKYSATSIANPGFFLIYGYLFFTGMSRWDFGLYKRKLKSRFKSLFIPYILWNLIPLTIILSIYFLTGQIEDADTINNPVNAFWNCHSHLYPLNVPLWFVRDLIIAAVMSPVYYFMIKRAGIVVLLLLFIYYLISNYDFMTIRGMHPACMFFFCLGGYLQLKNKSLTETTWKYKYTLLLLALISLALFIYYGKIHNDLFRKTYNLFGLPTAINVAFWLTKRYGIKANSFLLRCGFFVCAFHVCYLHQGNLLTKSTNLCKHILNGVPHMDAVQYLLPPFICIGICMLVFYLLQKNAPTVCNILTGNRATTNNNRK